jgi:hypothetical protein
MNNETGPKVWSTEETPRLKSYGETQKNTLNVDVSGQGKPDEFALLQKAGEAVGLNVYQVETLVSASGTVINISKGNVAYRYQTDDLELKSRFDLKLKELRDLSS